MKHLNLFSLQNIIIISILLSTTIIVPATQNYETYYIGRYSYTQKEQDCKQRETNMYYFGARHYDPEICRFTTTDPADINLIYPQTLNRYTYCRNNPINMIDLDGKQEKKVNPTQKTRLLSEPYRIFIDSMKSLLYEIGNQKNIDDIEGNKAYELILVMKVGELNPKMFTERYQYQEYQKEFKLCEKRLFAALAKNGLCYLESDLITINDQVVLNLRIDKERIIWSIEHDYSFYIYKYSMPWDLWLENEKRDLPEGNIYEDIYDGVG